MFTRNSSISRAGSSSPESDSPQTPDECIGRMRLSRFTTPDAMQPWTTDDMLNGPHNDHDSRLDKLVALAPKKLGGACLRTARALRRKMPRLETPQTRNMRKMQEEFVRECREILSDDEQAPSLLLTLPPTARHDADSPHTSDASDGTIEGPSPPPSPRTSPEVDVPGVVVRDMFTAVYDDNVSRLEPLLAKYPDALLGSWSGMSVLRYAIMVHTRSDDVECLMLLLNRFTLLNQRHGTLHELKDVFADALMALCERPEANGAEATLAMCFENYVMAHGGPYIETLAARLAARPRPVLAASQVMQTLAHDVLGPRALLPAVQSVCSIWAADLAMMSAAHTLGLQAVPADTCGRSRRVARALLASLDAAPELMAPQHAALRGSHAVLLGKDPERTLALLAMLLDD